MQGGYSQRKLVYIWEHVFGSFVSSIQFISTKIFILHSSPGQKGNKVLVWQFGETPRRQRDKTWYDQSILLPKDSLKYNDNGERTCETGFIEVHVNYIVL